MVDTKKRNDKIIELRKKGHTLDEISVLFNISKARVHQICKRSHQRVVDSRRHNIYYKFLVKACNKLDKNPTIATRIFNALNRNGIISEMEMFGRTFSNYEDDNLIKIHGIGKNALDIIHCADDMLRGLNNE